MKDPQIQDQTERGANMQGGFGTANGAPAAQGRGAQSLGLSPQGHAGGPVVGHHHVENARQVGHRRFTSLPKIDGPSTSSDMQATNPAEVIHASVDDAAAKTVLGRNSETWNTNFSVARPKDHIKHNIVRLLAEAPSQVPAGARRALSTYRVADRVQVEKKRLQVERVKIRNIIGNNPFRVKNYVQGDELDNDLMPLKLLKPKELSFNTDDEFIQHFLNEKKKEALANAEKKKKKAKATWQKLQLGFRRGAYGKLGNSGASQEEAADGGQESGPAFTKGKSTHLKASLQKLIDRRKAQQAAQKQAQQEGAEAAQANSEGPNASNSGKKLGERSAQRALDEVTGDELSRTGRGPDGGQAQKDNNDATGGRLEALPEQTSKEEGTGGAEGTGDAKDIDEDKQDLARSGPDQIFGDFDNEMEIVRRLMRRRSQDGWNAKSARAVGVLGPKRGSHAPGWRAQGGLSGYSQDKLAQNESLNQLMSLRRQESSIQQLGQLGQSGLSGTMSVNNPGNEQSLANLNFVPQGAPAPSSMVTRDGLPAAPPHGSSQLAYDLLTQSEGAESSQLQAYDTNRPPDALDGIGLSSLSKALLASKGLSLLDGSQARLSGLSFLPSQIQSFLSRKQPSQNAAQNLGPQSKQSLGTHPLNQQSNAYRSPSGASLDQTVHAKAHASDHPGNAPGGQGHSQVESQQDALAAMLRKDFMPGKAGQGPSVAIAMKHINKIKLNAQRLEGENLGLRELADRMQGRIQRDRSPINLLGQPDMFSNIEYFEKQFRLKKYEIEDLYLLRRVVRKDGEQLQGGQQNQQSGQGSLGNLSTMQAGLMHGHGQSIQQLHPTQSGRQLLATQSSALLLPQPTASGQLLGQAPSSQTFDLGQPHARYARQKQAQPPTRNNDVIHVTLEAASMKQLIKLSQDLIPEDQIEAEIEKQSTTRDGQNYSSMLEDQIEVDDAKLGSRGSGDFRSVHSSALQKLPQEGAAKMVETDQLQLQPLHEVQEDLAKISAQEGNQLASLAQHRPPEAHRNTQNAEFPNDWSRQHQQSEDQPKAPHSSSRHLLPANLEQISSVSIEQSMERTKYVGSNRDQSLDVLDEENIDHSSKAISKKESIGQAREKFSEFTFQKAEKESRIFQRQLKLGDNLQKYLDDKRRKERLWHDVEVGFRQTSPQNRTGDEDQSNEKTLQSQNSSEMLLTAANHFILNTKEAVIQSKIRSLLVGTELEDIAKSAQIVIHMQEDAKEYLRMKIREQQEKRRQSQIGVASAQDSLSMPKNKLAYLMDMNRGMSKLSANSSMKSLDHHPNVFNAGHVRDYGHTVLHQSSSKGRLGPSGGRKQPHPNQYDNMLVNSEGLRLVQVQDANRQAIQRKQGQKAHMENQDPATFKHPGGIAGARGTQIKSPSSQFDETNFGLHSRFNMDFTSKKGLQRQGDHQRGLSGFSGTLFNQNFQQNNHAGGSTSPRLMISNQMQDMMVGIDGDNFTDQMSGNRMKSKLGNVNSSDGDESVDVAERLGHIQFTKLSHEAMQGGPHNMHGAGPQGKRLHRDGGHPATHIKRSGERREKADMAGRQAQIAGAHPPPRQESAKEAQSAVADGYDNDNVSSEPQQPSNDVKRPPQNGERPSGQDAESGFDEPKAKLSRRDTLPMKRAASGNGQDDQQ